MADLRRRTDFWWSAGRKRAVSLGAVPDPRQDDSKNWDPKWLAQLNDDSFEPAQPGDVWEIRRSPKDGRTTAATRRGHMTWGVTGYGLWCPNEKCHDGVHRWTHASDCRGDYGEACKTGEKEGVQSCWVWTGSIEAGDLTANPSLFCNFASCGWHGYLRNGVMEGWIEAQYQ